MVFSVNNSLLPSHTIIIITCLCINIWKIEFKLSFSIVISSLENLQVFFRCSHSSFRINVICCRNRFTLHTMHCTQNHLKATKISEKVIKLVGERERKRKKPNYEIVSSKTYHLEMCHTLG